MRRARDLMGWRAEKGCFSFLDCLDAYSTMTPPTLEVPLVQVRRNLDHKLVVVVGFRCTCVAQSIRSPAVSEGKKTGRFRRLVHVCAKEASDTRDPSRAGRDESRLHDHCGGRLPVRMCKAINSISCGV